MQLESKLTQDPHLGSRKLKLEVSESDAGTQCDAEFTGTSQETVNKESDAEEVTQDEAPTHRALQKQWM